MAVYIGRVAYTAAVFDPELLTRAIPAGVMAATNIAVNGLETASAVLVEMDAFYGRRSLVDRRDTRLP